MNVLQQNICLDLQQHLQKILTSFVWPEQHKKINHINIYHRHWDEYRNSQHRDFLSRMLEELPHIPQENLLYAGFICAPHDCDAQLFHLDYFGQTDSYFVPMVDLNSSNGTEYLHFFEPERHLSHFDVLRSISNNYDQQEQLAHDLAQHDLQWHRDFEFRIHQSPAYSLYHLPHNILHRGQKNRSGKDRVLFQMVTSSHPINDIQDDWHIKDSELDEELNINHIVALRSQKNIA
jgi:hypothetical protein